VNSFRSSNQNFIKILDLEKYINELLSPPNAAIGAFRRAERSVSSDSIRAKNINQIGTRAD